MMTNAEHDEQRRDQTEFLADDGENKIGVVFRNEPQLLPSVAQAKSASSRRSRAQSWPDMPDNRRLPGAVPCPTS